MSSYTGLLGEASILINELQLAKTRSSMLVTLSGMVTLTRLPAQENDHIHNP